MEETTNTTKKNTAEILTEQLANQNNPLRYVGLNCEDVWIVSKRNVTTLVKQNVKRLIDQIYFPLVGCFGTIFRIYSLNTDNEIRRDGWQVSKESLIGEEMVLTVKDEYLNELSNSELFSHMFHWVPYNTLTWCCPFPEEKRCSDENPLWIKVTLKKTGNRHIALREYWEDGKLKTTRVIR